MDRTIAEKTALVVTQSNYVLDSYLFELKEQLPPDEFTEICKKFGKLMSEAFFHVLNPIWEEYPDLLPKKLGGTYNISEDYYKNIYTLIQSQSVPAK